MASGRAAVRARARVCVLTSHLRVLFILSKKGNAVGGQASYAGHADERRCWCDLGACQNCKLLR